MFVNPSYRLFTQDILENIVIWHVLGILSPSRARNAGESAICPAREQPSAEIVRVERAKCR